MFAPLPVTCLWSRGRGQIWKSQSAGIRITLIQSGNVLKYRDGSGGSMAEDRGIWLSGGSGYQGDLVIRGIWLSGGSGYQGNLVISGIWLSEGSGYQGDLIIRGIWLSGGSGYQGDLVIRGIWLSGSFWSGLQDRGVPFLKDSRIQGFKDPFWSWSCATGLSLINHLSVLNSHFIQLNIQFQSIFVAV